MLKSVILLNILNTVLRAIAIHPSLNNLHRAFSLCCVPANTIPEMIPLTKTNIRNPELSESKVKLLGHAYSTAIYEKKIAEIDAWIAIVVKDTAQWEINFSRKANSMYL